MMYICHPGEGDVVLASLCCEEPGVLRRRRGHKSWCRRVDGGLCLDCRPLRPRIELEG